MWRRRANGSGWLEARTSASTTTASQARGSLDRNGSTFRRPSSKSRSAGYAGCDAGRCAPAELIAFHTDPQATLRRRSVVLAADDGFRDAVLALARHAELRPFVFIPTSAVGGSASWVDGEPVASWSELQASSSSRGGVIGSHGLTHVSFPELDEAALAAELGESMRELRTQIPGAAPLLAYPHGQQQRDGAGRGRRGRLSRGLLERDRPERRGHRPLRAATRRAQGMGRAGGGDLEGVDRRARPVADRAAAPQTARTPIDRRLGKSDALSKRPLERRFEAFFEAGLRVPVELRVRKSTIAGQHRTIVGANSLPIDFDLHFATERGADQLHNSRSLDRLFSPDVARQ